MSQTSFSVDVQRAYTEQSCEVNQISQCGMSSVGNVYSICARIQVMRFTRDSRAQSVVLGTVVLFGFLIISLSVYQVEVVPQQNAEIEFQHFEDTRNDLVELRAGILQAGSIDQPQYRTVQLGTTYPTRIVAINPPPPAGVIRTTEAYPITISNGSGTPEGTITIPTRFIQYRPGYNELNPSPTWYDASVLYLDARDEGSGVVVIEDQALVDSGEVQITALQNEFYRSETGRVTLELRPARSVTGTIPEGDLSVTVPTRLSGEEYWDDTEISSEIYTVTNDANGDGVYNLTLETTANNLTVDTVGVQDAPDEPTQNDNARVGGDRSDGGDGGDGSGPSPGPQCVAGSYNVNSNEDRDIAYTGNVNVNANVNGDVIAGGSVIVNSGARVNGNIQAGGSVTVNSGARVTGDVSAGGSITTRPGSDIAGNEEPNINGYAPCNSE